MASSTSSRARTVAAVVVGLLVIGWLRAEHWHPLDPFVRPLVRQPVASVVWEGDSQSAPAPGVATTAEVAMHDLESTAFARTFATGGALLGTLIARAPAVDAALVDFPGTRNVLVVWAGTNDLGLGTEPAAAHEELRSYAAARRAAGWTVVVITALPRTFLGDVPDYEARRQAFNEIVRSQWPGYADLIIDVGSDPVLGVAGAQDDPRWYGPDHTHLTDEGRRAVASRVAVAFSRLGIE